MKFTKLFGLLAATFTLGLASCNSQPAKPADPVLMSIAVSGEYKTEYLVGEEFDSKLEQALLTDKVEGKKDEEVLEVLLKGYMLHDRVIRPATVKINKID